MTPDLDDLPRALELAGSTQPDRVVEAVANSFPDRDAASRARLVKVIERYQATGRVDLDDGSFVARDAPTSGPMMTPSSLREERRR
jgi:hypothetical protein